MKLAHPAVALLATVALAACGDKTPDETASPVAIDKNDPWFLLAELPPEAQPYGRDVYLAKCLACHGDVGQGVDGHPPLKGLSPAAMSQRLLDYRAGTAKGEKASIMTEALAGMSDAEIAAVALYAGE